MNIYKNLQNTSLVEAIKLGKIGVLPTDTTYGLVASASSPKATERIYKLKGRSNKPGTLIAANIEQLVELGIKLRYLRAVEHFWPNPISVIIPVGSLLPHLHQGRFSLAVRIPNDTKLVELLKQTGPLITSSTNLSGKKPAKNINQAQKYFDNLVDFYVDGGDLSSEPSTIIRIIDDSIEVVRQGCVKIDRETGRIEQIA